MSTHLFKYAFRIQNKNILNKTGVRLFLVLMAAKKMLVKLSRLQQQYNIITCMKEAIFF